MLRRLLSWARAWPVALGLCAGAVVGLGAGLMVPPPPSEGWTDGESGWALPTSIEVARVQPSSFERMRAGTMFGTTAAGPGGERATSWKLLGVVAVPAPTAVVSVAQGKVMQVPAGAELPDGSRLLGVDSLSIRYERDQCRYRRVLYDATEHAEGCAGTAVSNPEDVANDE